MKAIFTEDVKAVVKGLKIRLVSFLAQISILCSSKDNCKNGKTYNICSIVIYKYFLCALGKMNLFILHFLNLPKPSPRDGKYISVKIYKQKYAELFSYSDFVFGVFTTTADFC